MLAALLLAVATGATTAGVWFRATTSGPEGPLAVAVTGGDGAPGVAAGALVAAAAGLALALGRRFGTLVASVGLVGAGALVVASALAAVRGADRLAASAAGELVGAAVLDGAVTVAAGPWLAVACGAATVMLGVAVLVAGRRWQGPTSRHEPTTGPTGAEAPVSPRDDPGAAWDALSRGQDPS